MVVVVVSAGGGGHVLGTAEGAVLSVEGRTLEIEGVVVVVAAAAGDVLEKALMTPSVQEGPVLSVLNETHFSILNVGVCRWKCEQRLRSLHPSLRLI